MSVTIALVNPKHVENLAQTLRAAALLGGNRVVYSGNRIDPALIELRKNSKLRTKDSRIPREFRIKDYAHIELAHVATPMELIEPETVPVAIELLPGAQVLDTFEHPEDVCYVFGPEDGTLGRRIISKCYHHVYIATHNKDA